MKIEIWSDYVCPFCYIGERKLKEALNRTNANNVEIIFKSFELNPDSKEFYEESIDELLSNKYGISIEQARQSNERIISAAKDVGLEFNFKDLKPTNTFKSHRLSNYAKSEGKLNEYTEKVMESYFTKSLNISDKDLLVEIATEIGLDKEKAKSLLDSDLYSKEVRSDEAQARELGISGVPYFLFNGEVSINGAQPVEEFIRVIEQLSN